MDRPPEPNDARAILRLQRRYSELLAVLRRRLETTTDRERPALRRAIVRLEGLPVLNLREPTVSLVARAGVGKSTLLNALAGAQLLPTAESRTSHTQTAVDLVVDPAAEVYEVRVQFASRARWHERRAAIVHHLLTARGWISGDENPGQPERARAPDVAQYEARLQQVYGPRIRDQDGVFLQTLNTLTPEDEDIHLLPEAARALQEGMRVSTHTNPQAVREWIAPYVAVPRNAPTLELLVERVWITGPCPQSVIPPGVHVVDIPGIGDISQDRVRIARAALAMAGTVLVLASAAPTAERPFTSAMVIDELEQCRRAGQAAVLVLTGSEAAFEEGSTMAAADRAEAQEHGLEVEVIHTSAKFAFLQNGQLTPHATRFGVADLRRCLQAELDRSLVNLPQLTTAVDAAVAEWERDALELTVPTQGTSAPAVAAPAVQPLLAVTPQVEPDWEALTRELVAVIAGGMQGVHTAIQGCLAHPHARSPMIVNQWYQRLGERTANLNARTFRSVVHEGGRFRSAGVAGLVDLPGVMISVLYTGGGLSEAWFNLFSIALPEAIGAIETSVRTALVQLRARVGAPAREDDARLASRLAESLRNILGQRRRDLQGVLEEATRSALRPGLIVQMGPNANARMSRVLQAHIETNGAQLLSGVIGVLRSHLEEGARLLQQEANRQVRAAVVALRDNLRAVGAPPVAVPSVQQVSPVPVPAVPVVVLPAAVPETATPQSECQVSYDGPVTGRVQGCICREPVVCINCYLHLLATARVPTCPYCRQPYNIAAGYRLGDFSIHPLP